MELGTLLDWSSGTILLYLDLTCFRLSKREVAFHLGVIIPDVASVRHRQLAQPATVLLDQLLLPGI
jgi:hypothetical protein